MKNLIGILCILFACSVGKASGQGITFIDGKLKDAIAQAKAENKMVLVDFMADWCGPCKMMDEKVFSSPVAGEYCNKHFVCVKVNVDKEKSVAKRYRVNQMPTLLFLDADGKEVKRSLGALRLELFMRLVQLVKGDILSLEKSWELHQQDVKNLELHQQFLLCGLFLKEDMPKEEWKKWQFRIEKSMNDYLAAKPREQMINVQDFSLIMTYCATPKEDNESVEFIIDHLAEFKDVIPENVLVVHLNKYFSAWVNLLAMKGDLRYKTEIGRMDGDMQLLFASLPPDEKEKLRSKFTLRANGLYLLCGKKDQAEYIRLMQKYFEQSAGQESVEEYESTVQTLLTFTKGKLTPEAAQQALMWLDKLLASTSDADKQALYVTSMGDCFMALNDKAKAKECYNQAYLLSFQTKNVRMQTYLKQKLAGL